MPLWLQHTLALTLVACCLIFCAWQAYRSLAGKRSKLGSCCAKGCPTPPAPHPTAEKIHFLPVEMLRRKRG
jgi:hypothetical protein